MSEPMKQYKYGTAQDPFRMYMKSIRGTAQPPIPRQTSEELVAFWDEFCEAVNAIHDEPLDE